MKIHASGAFSMSGRKTVTIQNAAETVETSTTVSEVHGKFVTPTKASITLKIDYRSCGTKDVRPSLIISDGALGAVRPPGTIGRAATWLPARLRSR